MKTGKFILVLCAVGTLGGCVVAQKHTLGAADPQIELVGDGPLAVSALDHRPYVVNGDKARTHLGMLRNGVGIPFDVNTEQGRAVSDEIAVVLGGSLERAGFDVRAISTQPDHGQVQVLEKAAGESRLALLTINEFKSDTFARTRFLYNLNLKVFGADGHLLAESSTQGEESLGSGFDTSKYVQEVVPTALAEKLEYLLNNREVVEALQ